jgi:acetyltransferase, GNAT family
MVRLSHEDSGSSGRFVIYDDDIFAGEMTYTRRNDGNIVIDHTGVESAFGGKGYGGLLLAEAVGYARREGIKIVPVCSFVAARFAKDPTIANVKA